MRKTALLLLMLITLSGVYAQGDRVKVGTIVLSPYIAATDSYTPQARQTLMDKMRQMITQAGLSSYGVDEKFIMTAHVQSVQKEVTGTIPQKTAVQLSITFYIGNGVSGTLFTSHQVEVKGIGNDEDKAYMNAIRKISANDAGIQRMIAEGKSRILDFYAKESTSIVAAAKALATAGSYVEAIQTLMALPSTSRQYGEAQQLIGQYGVKYYARVNGELLNKARAAWSGSLSEDGARTAKSYLQQMVNPTAAELAEAKQLTRAMAQKLQADEAAEWRLLEKAMDQEHERMLARIDQETTEAVAAAAVAVARYEAQPRRVYHIHWW